MREASSNPVHSIGPLPGRAAPVVRIAVALLGVLSGSLASAHGQSAREQRHPKRVLVELFTSHGCDLCPKAEELLGSLAADAITRDRIVPIAFHVDYFNEPWKDPFSDPQFSRREWEYSRIYDKAHKAGNPSYLYLTPLLMIDGQVPMVGSNADAPQKARAAIARSLKERPEIGLDLRWEPSSDPRAKTIRVAVTALTARASGRAVLIGAAAYEDGLKTDVPSGENAGTTYTGRFVVRKLAVRSATPKEGRPAELTFPLELPSDSITANVGVAVYAQEESTGRIDQAASIPWEPQKNETAASPERAAASDR